jgi:ATP-binding cassette, subfamily B, bacterial
MPRPGPGTPTRPEPDRPERPERAEPVLGRALRVIVRGLRAEPGIFSLAVLGSLLYGAGTVASGWVLGALTDSVLVPAFTEGHVTGAQLAATVGTLSLVAVLTSVGVALRRAAAGAVNFRLQATYRRAVAHRYLRLPPAWHRRHSTGELLSRANADVEATWFVFAPLPMSLGVFFMLVLACIAMVLADPVLAAVGMLILPGLTVVNAVYQRRMSGLVMTAQHERAEVSAAAHESFEGALVVKTLGREDAQTRGFVTVSERLRDANIAVGRVRGLFDPLLEALPVLGTLAVLGAGAVRVSTGHADTGDVVQTAYLLSVVSLPVRSIGWVLGEIPRSVVGWERISVVLDAEDRLDHGDARLTGDGPASVELRGVGHRHGDPADRPAPALHGIDLHLQPGRTVALVGPTGSGKSTLVDLLARLEDPTEGTILLDGIDLRSLAPGQSARAVALAAQEAFVFDDTVRENVALGEPLPDQDLWRALHLAGAEEFVRELPGGLGAPLGERGSTLSGGQRQRLALARALARRPRLLVLDEATSAVDPRVEARILDNLRGATAGCTLLVVASRTATITLADDVVFLQDGRVTARGPHAELLETCAPYRDLVTAYERDAERRSAAAHPEAPDRPGPPDRTDPPEPPCPRTETRGPEERP